MITTANSSGLIRKTQFVEDLNLPFIVSMGSVIIMLLWAGAYKMTDPGAEGIVPLVTNSPFISWHFKLLGTYRGSDIIGATEIIAAILIFIGLFRPKVGMIGTFITIMMFTITSSMLITTPETIININGMGYMTFLGLFLFKDLVGLAVSLYLLSTFRNKAIMRTKKNN
ncbi:DUF417 family protein [Sinomicrobium pectinilyticum]|uniref:DUF417 family protein n=2 Tax=Sinomicrobium pectinilyticum TaxID=1084421 RepID=A0A3N0EQ42_SINP1|nr:DUF417 family protein [Sinomicrobium pectinilyticum]